MIHSPGQRSHAPSHGSCPPVRSRIIGAGQARVEATRLNSPGSHAGSHGIARKTQTRRSGSHGYRTVDLTPSLPLKGEGGSATAPADLTGAGR